MNDQTPEAQQQPIVLGYVLLQTVQENQYRGGIMLIDEHGVPLEVWISSPLQITKVQTILYGKSLGRHLATEVVGKPLFSALRTTPSIILCNQDIFLDMHSPERPVLMLQGQERIDIDLARAGMGADDDGDVNAFVPILERTAARGDEASYSAVLPRVRTLYSTMDLLEPFERLARAIAEVERAASQVSSR